jgi:hypothetical protein
MGSARKFHHSFLAKTNPSELRRWSVRGLIDVGPSVTPENARCLLEEVQTRLAVQLGR